jgi:hypothetical protein
VNQVELSDIIGGRPGPVIPSGVGARSFVAFSVFGLVVSANLAFGLAPASAQTTLPSAPTPTTTNVLRSAQVTPSVPSTPATTGSVVSVGVTPPTSAPASTVPPSVSVVVTQEIAPGFTNSSQPLGPQRTTITVVNQGPSILFNQQMVLKFGAKPDTVYFVKESGASVGVIDGTTGIWFHTIAQLTPATPVTYTVTWNKSCPGRWPLGVRVADAVSWPVFQWISPAVGVGCPPDETAKPESQALPWPASFPAPPVIAPIPVATSTTVPGGTSGSSGSSVTSGSTTTTTKPASTAPAVVPTITVTTLATSPSRPSTTVLFCRTVNKRRVCGPARVTKSTKPKAVPRATKP